MFVYVFVWLISSFFIRQNLPNQDFKYGWKKHRSKNLVTFMHYHTIFIFVYVAFVYCALFTTETVNIKTALHNIHLQLNFPTESHIFWTKLTSWHSGDSSFSAIYSYIHIFLQYIKLCFVRSSLGFQLRMHNYAQAHNVYQYSMELCKTKSIRLSRNRVKLYGVW